MGEAVCCHHHDGAHARKSDTDRHRIRPQEHRSGTPARGQALAVKTERLVADPVGAVPQTAPFRLEMHIMERPRASGGAVSGAGSPHSLRSRLRSLRPAAFGADPAGERLARIRSSPNFADGVFQNPEGTRTRPSSGSMVEFARTYFAKEARTRRVPARPVPLHTTTATDLTRPAASGLRLTWMGHSSVLAEIDGRRVLFDPVWGERCSPFTFAGPKRLHPVPAPLAALGSL